jgi:hypothetical protein
MSDYPEGKKDKFVVGGTRFQGKVVFWINYGAYVADPFFKTAVTKLSGSV